MTLDWPAGTTTHGVSLEEATRLNVQVGRAGRLGVTGWIRDTDGNLVATGASQLCCVPAPA